jgi:capsular polysaccharide export protein
VLQIPPFPRAKCTKFGIAPNVPVTQHDALSCIELMREHRVGGTFWGVRPDIPDRMQLLLIPRDIRQMDEMIEAAANHCDDHLISFLKSDGITQAAQHVNTVTAIDNQSDPWHVFDRFNEIWVDANSDLAFLAKVAGKRLKLWGEGMFSGIDRKSANGDCELAAVLQSRYVTGGGLLNPFTSRPMTLTEAAILLIFWQELINKNRDIEIAAGFALWKRSTVAPLLWPGFRNVVFSDDLSATNEQTVVAAWSSRLPDKARGQIAQNNPQIIEVEDGFIRSSGLGANCVPPLSIIADRCGIYFDPGSESDLEHILQNADIPDETLKMAEDLRQAIVAASISKYGNTNKASMPVTQIRNLSAGRKIILVPGQVEDDRSVQSGGGNITGNIELLKRVRASEPDGFLVYKPHPDIDAGHRTGAIDDASVMEYADLIIRGGDITELFSVADAVHVLTSLAGFEALLRGKPVTTHGVPFYAGWGLTTDIGAIPTRRKTRRNLAQLVAASLILYARYIDPVTGLPCPADILVLRLQHGYTEPATLLTRFRQLQGYIRVIVSKRISWFGA